MLSKADTKYINSLQNKKYRKIERAFFVEGQKNVLELLSSGYEILRVLATPSYALTLKEAAGRRHLDVEIVSENELAALGTLENNHSAMALARIKEHQLTEDVFSKGLVLALDGVNDPGNLGTVLRIADWYGIGWVICSHDTVDVYNPKVVNASKGSFARVQVVYAQLDGVFASVPSVPLYAACMEGESVYTTAAAFSPPAILLMGNEANGIREELMQYVTHKINIPRIGNAESLNVGVATAIIVDRFLGGK